MKKILIASLALLVSCGALADQYPDHLDFKFTVFNRPDALLGASALPFAGEAEITPARPGFTFKTNCKGEKSCEPRISIIDKIARITIANVKLHQYNLCSHPFKPCFKIDSIQILPVDSKYSIQQVDQYTIEVKYIDIPK